MIPFNIVVAIDKKHGIGKDGQLPWHLPEDLKHFKDITSKSIGESNVVIMGRKTWESIPERFRPLPGRINVVLTRNSDYMLPEGALKFDGFTQALESLEEKKGQIGQVFVIGGQQVFGEALSLPECQKLYITHILEAFDCDTFFSPFKDKFQLTYSSEQMSSDVAKYYFAEYERSSPGSRKN